MNAKRTIRISGGISACTAAAVVPALEALAAKSADDIFIIINSPGGSISAMLAITDAMDRSPCDIVTITKGVAMSAGSFIAANGTKGKRFSFPNCQLMFHQPNGASMYRFDEAMDHCRTLTERKLSEVSGMSLNEVKEITKQDSYFWPEEIVGEDFNVLDGIIGIGTF